MSLESNVAQLTQATTSLLSAVNAASGTIDARVGQATEQANLAEGHAASAEGFAEAAEAAQLDIQTNWADKLAAADAAADAATEQAGVATTQAGIATSQGNIALGAAENAQTASDAAYVNANVYADTTAGLAATTNGQQFQVISGQEVIRYKNDSGSAVEVAWYPASSLISQVLIPKKNFANPAKILAGKYFSPGQLKITNDASYRVIGPIPVTPGQIYTVSGVEGSSVMGVSTTTSQTSTFTSMGSASSGGIKTITIPANRYYLWVNLTATGATSYDGTVQIEAGSQATAYAAYQLVVDVSKTGGLMPQSNVDGLVAALAPVPVTASVVDEVSAPAKNLFDKTLARSGKRYSPASDAIITDANGRCTPFIPVTPGQVISISGGESGFTGGWFATASDTGTATDLGFASGTQLTATVPANRYYLVVNLTANGSSSFDNTLQVEVGSSPTSYESYRKVISLEKLYGELPLGKIPNGDKIPFMALVPGKNLLNPAAVNFSQRYSVGSKGFVTDADGIAASDWIAVTEGDTYTLSGAMYNPSSPQGGYFTSDGATTAVSNITWFSPPAGSGKCFTVPTGQGITHVVVSLRKLNDLPASTELNGTVQLERGELETTYEAYADSLKVPEQYLPSSGGEGSVASFDSGAWLKYVGGEDTPSNAAKWPLFRKHWKLKDKDLTVVVLGTSLTARTTEHHSDYPGANQRPPLLHSKNLASHLWDRLIWAGQKYSRYDDATGGSETSGTWATNYTTAEWDDGGYRNGLTRYCADTSCAITRNVPVGAYAWRFIYRTDSVAPTQVTVSVSTGNNTMQVYDKTTSSWIEANGYVFSQREATPVTRVVAVPNPDTGATSNVTLASKGNTTYQKRLQFRCKWSGVDTRATEKVVTFTNTSGGRMTYWGHEWSPRPYMVTLINAARGSHNTQATGSLGLPRYADNEVHGFAPDLIYMELPIHNDGAAAAGIYATWDRWGRLTNNYVFSQTYELALLTRAAHFGYTPEIGMWTPSIAYGFEGISEAGDLIFSDQTDGVPMTALDKFDQAASWVDENKPDVVFVNAVHRWVDAGYAIFGDLKSATIGSSKIGPTMTNDGGHANDVGDAILAKVVCGPFCWDKS